ncbi:mechanosensitive ion channel domain-containing protein [Ottowia flava]|uniref:Small-conductance mechanosensitive channel n=1 Tax=Ottowia flava TaxID=2675430 RepID=A0ABW4KRL9_9BURK|nr:mechanosensitive ion channel domain-containing protein [Ottowia sp. GY511]
MLRLTDFFLARSLAPWSRLRALALLVATCALTLPAAAQDVVQAITALTQSSRPSAAASEAPPPQADPKLVQQAARATQKDDERILAQVTARLARSASFRLVSASVQAGVAVLSGSVPDNESRQLAAKVVGAVDGVVAVENQLTLAADFNARLRETWEIFKDRVTRFVAAIPLMGVAVLIVFIANGLGGWLSRHLGVVRLDSHNPFLGTVVRRGVRAGFLIVGLLLALDLLGATSLVTALLGSAGVVGIVLGFAFRDMAENYLSGILLSLRRPFEPRDHVRIDAHEGRVVSLSTRNTVLMTLDGNELLLPNATVFKAVILNFTHNPKRRLSFQLSIGSDKDLQAAQDLGVATLAAMTGVLNDPGPSAAVDAVTSASVAINYYAWVDQRETDFGKARSEAIRLVKLALEQAGMGIATTVYQVKMLPPDAASPAPDPIPAPVQAAEVASAQGDVSPSTELEDQLTQERARKAGQDMLNTPSPRKAD